MEVKEVTIINFNDEEINMSCKVWDFLETIKAYTYETKAIIVGGHKYTYKDICNMYDFFVDIYDEKTGNIINN